MTFFWQQNKEDETMRKKNITCSVKLSEKNRLYMERLGFIDGRSGRSRPGMNLNRFLNHCIIHICESGKLDRTRPIATSNDLLLAWKKYQMRLKARQIAQIQKEIIAIGNIKTEKESTEMAREIVISSGATEDLLGWD